MSEPIPVILVEDDAVLRESLASYLGLVGHAVTAVGNSLAYYRALGEGDFAAAIIDLGLPDQSGEVLVRYTRHNTSCAIIVITARDILETRIACYQAGADLFLGKPVNGRDLVPKGDWNRPSRPIRTMVCSSSRPIRTARRPSATPFCPLPGRSIRLCISVGSNAAGATSWPAIPRAV